MLTLDLRRATPSQQGWGRLQLDCRFGRKLIIESNHFIKKSCRFMDSLSGIKKSRL